MTKEVPQLIKVELIEESSTNAAIDVGATGVHIAMISVSGPCWMDPIIDYLAEDRVPDDENKANRIRRMTPRY